MIAVSPNHIMKVLSLTLVALAGTANAGYSGSTAAQTGSVNQFESWVTDEFRRLTTTAMHGGSATKWRELESHVGGTGGATGGATDSARITAIAAGNIDASA